MNILNFIKSIFTKGSLNLEDVKSLVHEVTKPKEEPLAGEAQVVLKRKKVVKRKK